MFSGFCGLFDHKRIIKKCYKSPKVNSTNVGENHWIQKRKMYLYSERGRNNDFQGKKLGNVPLHTHYCIELTPKNIHAYLLKFFSIS